MRNHKQGDTQALERAPVPAKAAVRGLSADVLVVGAGPAGLLMASELARRGVSCRIVEKLGARVHTSRAITAQARTLEIFADMGIADEILALGHPARAVSWHAAKRGGGIERIAGVSLDELESPFRFQLNIPQNDTERVLEGLVQRRGLRVERLVEFRSLSQDERGLTAELRHVGTDRVENARFGWLIGCDGAHSDVRAAIGLPFEGSSYGEAYTLGDLRMRWDLPADEGQVIMSPRGALMFMPFRDGLWRLFADLDPPAPGREYPEPDLDTIRELAERRGLSREAPHDVVWMSVFALHRRMVPGYRAGRVFLAGDAAHVHSAILAQGMNTALGDAYNLAWKLALTVHGQAAPGLLDSYNAERHAIARRVLRDSHRATRALTLRNPIAGMLRNRLLKVLLSRERVQKRIVDGGAQIDFAYPRGPLLTEDVPGGRREFRRGPAPGWRAPHVEFGPPGHRRALADLLHGGNHVLLLFGGSAAEGGDGHASLAGIAHDTQQRYGDLTTTHLVIRGGQPPATPGWAGSVLLDPDGSLHDRFAATAACLYLIRPDMYIGYRAQPADGSRLTRYLDRVLAPAEQMVAAQQAG